MAITPLPTPTPSRNQTEAVFVEAANAFLGALPAFGTEANALASTVNADKVTAAAAALAAAASQTAAAASETAANAVAGAGEWASGTYAKGATAWSPVNFQTYRAKLAHTGAVDPSSSPTNWALVGTFPGTWIFKSSAYTAAAGERIGLNVTGGGFTVTMPASPVTGDAVSFGISGGDATINNVTVGGNGKTIHGDATLIVNKKISSFTLTYNGTEWRVV
jgi:hypothetical protein